MKWPDCRAKDYNDKDTNTNSIVSFLNIFWKPSVIKKNLGGALGVI